MFEPNQEVYTLHNYRDMPMFQSKHSKKERQVICGHCGKHFYASEEGFKSASGHLICADCYHKRSKLATIHDGDYDQ